MKRFFLLFILCGLVAWPPVALGFTPWYFGLLAHSGGVLVPLGVQFAAGYLDSRRHRAHSTTDNPWGRWQLMYEPHGEKPMSLGVVEGLASEAMDECQRRVVSWHFQRGDFLQGAIRGRYGIEPVSGGH